MKTITTLFILILSVGVCCGGGLSKVEEITLSEKKALVKARSDVARAQESLRGLEQKVCADHKFTNENWMEWRSWCEFDGNYILQYHQSFMFDANSVIYFEGTP